MNRRLAFILIALCLLVTPSAHAGNRPLSVVASITLIADVAQNVGGDLIQVTSLVPPESDMHSFEPAPQDAVRLTEADLVLVNGAGLEEPIAGLLEETAQVVVVSNRIEVLPYGEHEAHEAGETHTEEHGEEYLGVLGDDLTCDEPHDEEAEHAEAEEEHEHGVCDPHFWTDPRNVMIWTQNIAEAFAVADPANAEIYRANAASYVEQLEALDAEVREILSTIPDERRVLLTNHEFLAYFAHAYEFEIVGTILPASSALAEPDPQTVADLIQLVRERHVPSIFTEASLSSGLAEVIAAEAGIEVVTTLYSDALSLPDGPASTYLDYLLYNAQTIVEALAEET